MKTNQQIQAEPTRHSAQMPQLQSQRDTAQPALTVTGYVPPPNFRKLGKVCGFTDLANAYENLHAHAERLARLARAVEGGLYNENELREMARDALAAWEGARK